MNKEKLKDIIANAILYVFAGAVILFFIWVLVWLFGLGVSLGLVAALSAVGWAVGRTGW